MENGMTTAMICLDLSMAFDTVNHNILKLIIENHFGIESTALNGSLHIWKMTIRVQICNSISAIKVINHISPTRKHTWSSAF